MKKKRLQKILELIREYDVENQDILLKLLQNLPTEKQIALKLLLADK